MCIHTHTNSNLMRALTAVMLSGYAARPVTLVNYRKEPHEHFTLYASGHEGAQRAADLLNAWHREYRGAWAAFTKYSYPRIRDFGQREPAFPSIEWPDEPSPNFVAAICFAYGTMTADLPDTTRCFAYAHEQLLAGPERDLALQLISVIRGVDYAASEAPADVVAAEAPAEDRVYRVVWRDENGNYVTDTYDDTHEVQVATGGVLAVVKADGTMAALYADGTWETVR